MSNSNTFTVTDIHCRIFILCIKYLY